MNLSINRQYRHKYFKNSVIRTSIRASLFKSAVVKEGAPLNLYVDLIQGERIVGMEGNASFMLATHLRQDEWARLLEQWARDNQYEEIMFQISQKDAALWINEAKSLASQGCRLGQALLSKLGDNTPLPNDVIFNSTDDTEVIDWFYRTHVQLGV